MTRHMPRTTLSCSWSFPVPNSSSVFRDIYTKYNFMTVITDVLPSAHHLQTKGHCSQQQTPRLTQYFNSGPVAQRESQSCSEIRDAVRLHCQWSPANTCSVSSTLIGEGLNTLTTQLVRKLLLQ